MKVHPRPARWDPVFSTAAPVMFLSLEALPPCCPFSGISLVTCSDLSWALDCAVGLKLALRLLCFTRLGRTVDEGTVGLPGLLYTLLHCCLVHMYCQWYNSQMVILWVIPFFCCGTQIHRFHYLSQRYCQTFQELVDFEQKERSNLAQTLILHPTGTNCTS